MADREGPAVETGAKSNSALVWEDRHITKGLIVVGGDNDVHGLDDTGEVLEQIFFRELEFEERTIDLVDDDNRFDTLTECLSEHSLGLHAHTFDGVDDDERAIGDTESGRDLGREIDVAGRVDQVDQEVVLLRLDRDVLEIALVGQTAVKRDGRGLDRHTTFLLVCSCVRKPCSTGVLGGDNSRALDEGVGEGGFAVVDVGDDGHVSDVDRVVHEPAQLLDGKSVRGILSVSLLIRNTVSIFSSETLPIQPISCLSVMTYCTILAVFVGFVLEKVFLVVASRLRNAPLLECSLALSDLGGLSACGCCQCWRLIRWSWRYAPFKGLDDVLAVEVEL